MSRKYLEIESYTCPVKKCPYVVAPGMAPEQGPPMAVKTQKVDGNRLVRERIVLFCPIHTVGLTRNIARQRIEPYKGTPRLLRNTIEKKRNLPKIYTQAGGR